jgi:hypothetical protein
VRFSCFIEEAFNTVITPIHQHRWVKVQAKSHVYVLITILNCLSDYIPHAWGYFIQPIKITYK